MLAWRVVRYGSPSEALSLDDIDDPVPGDNEALVEVCDRGLGLTAAQSLARRQL